MTKKERNLVKAALRRVFSRSELRLKVLNSADITHTDPKRPRVRKWSMCSLCKKPTPKYTMVIDHIDPVIPVHRSFETMSIDEVVARLWCEEANLQAICTPCHAMKTKGERSQRTKRTGR